MKKLLGVMIATLFITTLGTCNACVTQTGPDTYTVDPSGSVDV